MCTVYCAQVMQMIKKISYKDQIYDYLKQAIITGEMKTSEIYSEQMIADKLNVSRTPVREAVLQLRFENLVDVFSGRGFGIRPVHFFDVQQIIQARTAIEGAGLRALIIGLDTPEGQETLQQMEWCVTQDMPAKLSDESNYDFMRVDMAFHMLSISFTGNEFFIQIMNTMQTRLEQAMFKALDKQKRPGDAIGEHEKIYLAVRRRDTDGAISALADHMRMTESILREKMDD